MARRANNNDIQNMLTLRATGLTQLEIAELLDFPVSAVQWHLNSNKTEKPQPIMSCKLYSDTASDLDDTKLLRWPFMPERTNIAVMQREGSTISEMARIVEKQ